MTLPSPPPYSQPIPNNPFYSLEQSNVCTQSGTLTIGCGLGVCYNTGTLVALGDGAGTVQQINTGTGLTGGPITVSGTVALAPLSPSSAGSYTYPTALDVDAYGRITSVTNGTAAVPASAYNALGAILAGTGVGSYSALAPGALNQVLTADPLSPLGVKWEYTIPDGVTQITGTLPVFISNPTGPTADVAVAVASLASTGVVQLNDSVASTSTSEAATPNAVKTAYDAGVQGQTDAAAALLAANNAQTDATQALTDSAAAQLTADNAQTDATQALADAAAAQATADAAVPNATFTASGELLVGSGAGTYTALPAGGANTLLSSDGLGNLSWVADSAGDVTGVTGTAPITVDNTDPQNPIVSVDAASTMASGVVQLNDTVVSTSTTEAATANAVKTAYDLANAAVPDSSFTVLGDLLVGTGAATFGNLVPGLDGDRLVVNSLAPLGVEWAPLPVASTSGAGVVQLNNTTTSTSTTQAVTANVAKLTHDAVVLAQSDATTALGLANAAIPKSTLAAKGDIVTATAASTAIALPVGTNGQVLIADSTCSAGLKWAVWANPYSVCQGSFTEMQLNNPVSSTSRLVGGFDIGEYELSTWGYGFSGTGNSMGYLALFTVNSSGVPYAGANSPQLGIEFPSTQMRMPWSISWTLPICSVTDCFKICLCRQANGGNAGTDFAFGSNYSIRRVG